VHAPPRGVVGEDLNITLRISNFTAQSVALRLQSSDLGIEDNNGLYVTGLSSVNLGILGVDESIETTITVCPLSGGLHDLRGLYALDTLTTPAKEYHAGTVCKIFVYDDVLMGAGSAQEQ
jgi:hypothetical protein